MKILVTGCAGFIGNHSVHKFLTAGEQVIGIDNLSRIGAEDNLERLKNKAQTCGQFTFYSADMRNFEAISQIFATEAPFDLIIHQAGQVAVTCSVTNPREDFESNALGTFNILEAMRIYSANAFLIFSSTNKVYGGMENLEIVEKNNRYQYNNLRGISENFALDFHSPYGCSKGAADQYVRDYNRIYGLQTVVLRQSCIYGTHQYGMEDQGWVAWFIIGTLLDKTLTIYGDGKQIRDVLWIDDLLALYWQLFVHRKQISGQIFNVGGGPANTLSLLELVSQLRREHNLQKPVQFTDWRPGDQRVYVSNIDKVTTTVEWTPTVSPAEGIRLLCDWVADNRQPIKRVIG